MIRSKAILNAARGEACTMHTPVCNYDAETTVACHSNLHLHGKGMGGKADDLFVAFGCSACHHWLDTSGASKEDRLYYWSRGHAKTLERLVDRGIIKIEGYTP